MSTSLENPLLSKVKWLTQALIISGVLNIAFLFTCGYFALREKHTAVSFDLKPVDETQKNQAASSSTNEQANDRVLAAYSQLNFQDLILRLENKEHIEEGYMRRDLALSCLVAFHHFNLEKALGGLLLPQRVLFFTNPHGEERVDVKVFPGLTDYQFQAILNYAKTEKWPLTSQGLFFELKRSAQPRDPTLIEAFYFTPEFHMANTLFVRSGLNIGKETLLEMLLSGEWSTLQEFAVQQRQTQDLSLQRRQAFLLSYLQFHSPVAAKVLLESDFEFACKKLEDSQILLILSLFHENFPALENFAKELISSQRSDLIWKKAAERLYAFAQEPIPEPYDHLIVLKRFAPQAVQQPIANAPQKEELLVQVKEVLKPTAPSKSKPAKKIHVVQEGENLWKIARKYKVSIENIKKANHLESDRLRPGKKLEIPES